MSCTTCPTTVPTFPFKNCDNTAIIHTKDYEWDTGTYVECYDSDPVMIDRPKYKVSFSATNLSVETVLDWYSNVIKHGTLPFALYCDWGGSVKWYLVRFISNNLKFNIDGIIRGTALDVNILGYAKTVTEPTTPDYIICDGEVAICEEDGTKITCGDSITGTATDIICFKG